MCVRGVVPLGGGFYDLSQLWRNGNNVNAGRVNQMGKFSDVLRDALDVLLAEGVAKIEIKTQYWVRGSGDNEYCLDCCRAAVAKIKAAAPDADVDVDGGWRQEEDGLRFCDTCDVALDVSFTEYAVGAQLDSFDGYAFDVNDPLDCLSLSEMLNSTPWKDSEHSHRVRRLAFKALRGLATPNRPE